MKYLPTVNSVILSGIILFVSVINWGCKQRQDTPEKLRGRISISGAFALYPLTVKWAEEFRKEYPHIRIDISAGGAGKGMTDVLSDMVDLAMFSRGITQVEIDQGAFGIAVARDAVIPTISSNNPYLEEIKTKGFTRQMFKDVFINSQIRYWKDILGNKSLNKVTLFTRSDASGAAEMWGQYLGANQESLQGIGVFGDPGMADAVKRDYYSIGYNNIIFAYDISTRLLYEGLEVIPLDLNENGKIDPEEDFYGTLDELMEAIRIEVFPAPPARPLYLITNGKPENPLVKLFLEWILTKGQAFVGEAGYVGLTEKVINAELQKLQY